jgi:hypothetical protein
MSTAIAGSGAPSIAPSLVLSIFKSVADIPTSAATLDTQVFVI